jgi:hypothetical protein
MGSILPDVFLALGFLPHYSEDESHDFLDGDDEGIGGLAAVEDTLFS